MNLRLGRRLSLRDGHDRHVATGQIVAAEEERFRLRRDDGDTLLLTLSTFAGARPRDLKRWEQEDRRVRVEYEGEPNLASGKAHSVTPLTDS